MAQRRYDRYVEMVDMAGPFGGATLGQRAREEREDVYEREMLQCLGARGYEVRTPGVPFGVR